MAASEKDGGRAGSETSATGGKWRRRRETGHMTSTSGHERAFVDKEGREDEVDDGDGDNLAAHRRRRRRAVGPATSTRNNSLWWWFREKERKLPETFMVEHLERVFYAEWWRKRRETESRRTRRKQMWWGRRTEEEPWDDSESSGDEDVSSAGGPVSTTAVLLGAAWRPLFLCLTLSIVRQATLVLGPLWINLIVSALEDDDPRMDRVALFVFLFLVMQMLGGVCFRINSFRLSVVGVNVRSMLHIAIAGKAARLSQRCLNKLDASEVTTLISTDVERLVEFIRIMFQSILSPLAIVGIIALLFYVLGVSFFAGLAVIIVGLLVNGAIFAAVLAKKTRQVGFTEERLRVFCDLLQGVRVIKCMTWEDAALAFCTIPRKEEVRIGSVVVVLQSLQISIFLFTAPVGLLLSFVVYNARGSDLTPAIIFSSLALLSALRAPMIAFPMSLAYLTQARIAMRRISAYLNREERRGASVAAVTRRAARASQSARMISACISGRPHGDENESSPVEHEDAYYKVQGEEYITSGRLPCDDAISLTHCTFSWVGKDQDERPMRFCDQSSVWSTASVMGSIDTEFASSREGRGRGFSLVDISLRVRSRELVVVVGTTGSGKTALLESILGEMSLMDGFRSVVGQCELVPQDPWTFEGSVRENIVMGRDIPSSVYEKVIWSCDLHHDFAAWPQGDESKLASVKHQLSGGQRMRINVARAACGSGKIVLLDEALVGLDASVARKVFVRCIKGVMNSKTRILVSKDPFVIRLADRVLVMDGGRLVRNLSRQDIRNLPLHRDSDILEHLLGQWPSERMENAKVPPRVHFADPVGEDSDNLDNGGQVTTIRRVPLTIRSGNGDEDVPNALTTRNDYLLTTARLENSSIALGLPINAPLDVWNVMATSRASVMPFDAGDLTHTPHPAADSTSRWITGSYSATDRSEFESTWRHQGVTHENTSDDRGPSVELLLPYCKPTWSTYAAYLSRGGIIEWSVVLTLILAAQVSLAVAEYLLARWAQSRLDSSEDALSESSSYLALYGAIVSVYAACLLLASTIESIAAYRASFAFYQDLLRRTFYATTTFLGKVSVGHMLSMHLRDVDTLDVVLVASLNLLAVTGANMIAAGVVVAISIPYLVIVQVFFIAAFVFLLLCFRAMIQKLIEEEVNSRALTMTTMHPAITRVGVIMLRSYQSNGIFGGRIRSAVNEYARTMWRIAILNYRLGILLEILSLLLVTISCAVAIGLHDTVGPARVALVITNTWLVSHVMSTTADVFSQCDIQMQSVARIRHFTKSVVQEQIEPEQLRSLAQYFDTSSFIFDKCRLYQPSGWTRNGTIRLVNVSMRYSEGGQDVLRSISLNICRGKFVGVIGRSGSGKSSLASVLLRLSMPHTGHVLIDGVDAGSIGLHAYRRAIGYLPQDSFVFSDATLRQLLDFDGAHSDVEILGVLEDVGFDVDIAADSSANILDQRITTVGITSSGQQQLICFARLLLQDPDIYVFDEASAHVDDESEQLMLRIIAGLLKRQKTVIWIAHKLETIVDAEEVFVLDGGVIVEQGVPSELLKSSQSIMYRLMHKQSDSKGRRLRDAARIENRTTTRLSDAGTRGSGGHGLLTMGIRSSEMYGDYFSLAKQYQQYQLVRSLSAPPPRRLEESDDGAALGPSPLHLEETIGEFSDLVRQYRLRRAYSEPPAVSASETDGFYTERNA